MAGRLAGRVCVVTGTGGSMGRAAALTFAREGASVVGCDLAAEPAAATIELVRAAGGEMVSLHPSRISDPAECTRLVELAVTEYGRIDVLYNLAAKSHFSPIETFTDAEWDAARRDEVDLVFYLTRAAWPHLKASRGVVLNMASLNGSLSFKNLPAIAHMTNKAAIIGMTRQLALEGSEHGIRVNSTRRASSKPTPPGGSWRRRSSAARCATGHSSAGSVRRRTLRMQHSSSRPTRAPT